MSEYIKNMLLNGAEYELEDIEARNNISALNSNVAEIKNELFEAAKITDGVMWQIGGFSNSGTFGSTVTNRARLYTFIPVESGSYVETNSDYLYRIATYSGTTGDTFMEYINEFTSETTVIPNDCYIRIVAKFSDNRTIVTNDIVGFYDNVSIFHSVNRFTKIESEIVPNLSGKTIAILGDSISTNGNSGTNANAVEITVAAEDVGVELSAYLTYYDVQNGLSLGGHTFTSAEIGTEVTFTPTTSDIGKSIGLPNNYNDTSIYTWWEYLCDTLHCNATPVCWSGASITSHESDTNTRKCSHAWHDSQIRKCGIRTAGTMERTAPDAIIIFRGTNDFSHTPYTLLTEEYFDNINFDYPTTDVVDGGYGYKEGYVLTIKKLREAYPNAKIFLCTLNVFKRINYAHFPTNNGINTLPQYNNAIREIADYMGCGIIELDKCGITFENCYSEGYLTDSATIPTHPSNKGHLVIGKKAVKDFCTQWSNME